jgi:hypothetical protein
MVVDKRRTSSLILDVFVSILPTSAEDEVVCKAG